MPTGWIIAAVLVAAALGLLLWAAGRWLARSWEVLDDDQLAARLAPHARSASPALWLLVRGWLSGGPRRLTYRRDKRGRFRRVRR
jgi:hypothetical protein